MLSSLSERRVAGLSAWEVLVDAASDSVLDLKFLLSVQPALQAAGLKPDHMRLYARLPGQPARAELADGQGLRESGALSMPAGRVVRVMFEVPSGVPGHGLIHCTRQNLNERETPDIRTMVTRRHSHRHPRPASAHQIKHGRLVIFLQPPLAKPLRRSRQQNRYRDRIR